MAVCLLRALSPAPKIDKFRQGACRFYLSIQNIYITQKRWQWSIDKQKIYAIIRSRLQAKSIKQWGIMGLLNEIAERLLKNFLSLKEDDCDKFNGCYFIVKQMPKYP